MTQVPAAREKWKMKSQKPTGRKVISQADQTDPVTAQERHAGHAGRHPSLGYHRLDWGQAVSAAGAPGGDTVTQEGRAARGPKGVTLVQSREKMSGGGPLHC